MKKVILVLLTLFIGAALADSVPTSVGYVDSQIGELQNKISAVDTNTVLTTTNTAGESGQKSIYDATGNYAEQQNALVTAEVANAAIQNAIDNEFVCIEWLGDEHIDANCLIWQLGAVNYAQYNLLRSKQNATILGVNTVGTVTFDANTKIVTALINSGVKNEASFTFKLCWWANCVGYMPNHKYYFRAKMRTTAPGVNVGISRSTTQTVYIHPTTEWGIYDTVFDASDFNVGNGNAYPVIGLDDPGGYEGIQIDQNEFWVYDLTDVFGAGNEPATADAAAKALGLLYMPTAQE